MKRTGSWSHSTRSYDRIRYISLCKAYSFSDLFSEFKRDVNVIDDIEDFSDEENSLSRKRKQNFSTASKSKRPKNDYAMLRSMKNVPDLQEGEDLEDWLDKLEADEAGRLPKKSKKSVQKKNMPQKPLQSKLLTQMKQKGKLPINHGGFVSASSLTRKIDLQKTHAEKHPF